MQLGEIFLCLPPRGEKKVAPQGRMRGACAAEPREEAIAARLPLISPLCGQLPPRGEAFSPLPFVHKPFLIY